MENIFFSYYWFLNEKEEEVTSIRIYGIDENNNNICVRVNDFYPYIYIELPTNISWNASRVQLVGNKIDQLLPKNKPLKKIFEMKYKLYGADLTSNGQRKKFPYLKCHFSHKDDIKKLGYIIKKSINILGIGYIKLKMHEQDADPILQLVSNCDIPTAGWIKFKGKEVLGDDKVTLCHKEYIVKSERLFRYDKTIVATPKIMGFDIEVNSTNPFAMPSAQKQGDKVFQISCVFAREGCSEEDYDIYILTLGEPDPKIVGENVTIYMYDTEYELLIGFTELIRTENPNVIVGYNILQFDIHYMIERAKYPCYCIGDFDKMGFHKYNHAKEKTIKWSSSAYKNQEFQFLDAEGRLFVDLLPLIRRDYKFNNYQLKTVSMNLLGDTKDDLSVRGIFKCYRIGTKKEADGTYSAKAKKAMGIVGKYCFPGNTKISTPHGNIPIEKLINNKKLLSWDENLNNINIANQKKFFNNGKHKCIEIHFEDGRKLVCTPDHLIATQKNEWIPAKNIKNGDYIKIGPILPDKEIDTEDMILSRLIGYLVSDGHIGKDRCKLYVGNLFDCKIILDDIEQLTNIRKNIIYGKNCMDIDLPPILSKKIKKMKGIMIGNRTYNLSIGLPDVSLWNKNCIKEFLGGLFGGDGWCTSLSKEKKTFTTIGLTQSRYDREYLIKFLNIIKILLLKFDIVSNYTITKRKNLYIGKIIISHNYLEKFMTIIGYRYCYHKTLRSTVALIYFRIRNKVKIECENLYKNIIQLRKNNISIKKAYEKSLIDNIYSYYMPKYETTKQWVRTGFPQSRKDLISSCFPKADYFIKIMGATDLFISKNKYEHTYSMSKEQDFLPVFNLKVLFIKDSNEENVYDLEVENTHSFLAEGIVVHNCIQDSVLVVKLMEKTQTWVGLTEQASTYNTSIFSIYTQGQQIKVFSQVYKYCLNNNIIVEKDGYVAKEDERYVGAHVFPPEPGLYERVLPFDFASLYPSTIIAYNIDYSTIVFDESIPDSLCHVMEWSDHLFCDHDPKVIRKKQLSDYIETQQYKLKELREKRDKKTNKLCRKEIVDEINKITEEMKPYREERAQVAKTISKNTMCAERRYRFLKEPKGVIPTILQNLLDARANTRKIIKNNKKDISILEDKDKIKDLKLLNNVLDKRQLAYKISANSMYGSMGVKKGYLPFMPGAMCLHGDSLISYSYGFTRKMKNLKYTNSLWSYNDDGQVISNGNGLIYNGKKEIVKITLNDGRILRCTSDHKIMTSNGWIEAGKLLPKHNWDGNNFTINNEYSNVIVGLELPEDIIGEDEKKWKLLDYTMDTYINREKTLAFCRILGFILSDGTISRYKNKYNITIISSSVDIGTLIDAKIFVSDIKLITGKEPLIGDYKGNTYTVRIPSDLIKQIVKLDGVMIGKRSHQSYTLPEFLFDSKCPLSVIREFLGGLFGGDGTSPSLSVAHPSFSPIQLGWLTIEKYKDDMVNIMNKLIQLLSLFDIKFWLCTPKLARVREGLIPKDIEENPRWEYIITTNSSNTLLFAEKIGFRYCSDKNNKLTVASSYQRYSDNVRKQHINLILKTSEMYDLNNKKIGIKEMLIKTRKELYENEIPLHEHISISKSTDVNNHRSRPISLKDYNLLQKYFPTAREYTRLVGCEHWFSENKCSKKVYSIKRTDICTPCIYLDVVDVRHDGIDDVYDIIDVPNHSFLANGIVVHNCTTYMGRTNIEIVAKTIPEKYGGELVYGDTDCVLATEPVLIKYNDNIDYKTVEELSDGNWTRINPNKEISNVKVGYQIWSDNGFTNIINVVRCGIKKPLSRVLTHVGVVNCSNEHSLLTDKLESVTPLDIKIGDKLCISELPLPSDTPKKPLYNNKVTKEIIEDYIIPNIEYKGLKAELAFVWGLFFADGSCGEYLCGKYYKSVWAINNQDNVLLERVLNILKNNEVTLNFKIYDTMKSSNVNKIEAVQYSRKKEHSGTLINFVNKYRNLFYDDRKYKKIPTIIFNSPFDIRQSFFMGYYSGDGSRKDPALCLSNKGAIGSAGLFYIMKSIGYQVSINTRKDKQDIYKLTGSNPEKKLRREPNVVKKIINIKTDDNEYIYDIQTENHHFAAGVGQLVVHNSNYIHFPKLKTAHESWDHAEMVAQEVSKLFPKPIKC